ncbi:sunset domain-containing protein [Nocardioides jiangxiensis]|uniref:Uncharacterized protein n=1 Tax=Nocardioides jiangxiensis TaxID=3064524 RepID=A0ABT9AXJ5_9ACTN|nr:hypothetical protein [Nocardioides sp. WY-20]MDO7866993.1 hypothetical protein [Nocardioides sp. WY-20]
MHTPKLTDVTAPALEKVGPVLDRVTDHVPHHRPQGLADHLPQGLPHGLVDHLPDAVRDHLPGAGRCSRVGRARRFAADHRRGVTTLGLLALVGAVVGWFVARRSAEAPWAPSHSSAPDATSPTSGYAKREEAATGAAGSAGGAADRGADDGFGGAAVGGTAQTSEGPYGAGSAAPLEDGTSPGAAYTIKGDSTAKVFHTRDSSAYDETRADVWFADADAARAAGFEAWTDE